MPRYEYRYRRPQRRRLRIRWLLLPVLIIALLAYPFLEARMLRVEERLFQVANLPGNLKNLKIVYATDIHQGPWFSQERVDELVRQINNLSADIVILGGDYANDSAGAVAFFQNAPTIHARLGVYAVLGESEHAGEEGNLSEMLRVMKDKGVTVLMNSVSRVKVGQSQLFIAGVDDPGHGLPDVAEVARQVRADDFVIFVGHTPDLLSDMRAARGADNDNHWYDLALFGHTHGGQINVFGHTPFSANAPALGARYLSGWLEENRAGVLISNGVGTSHLPIRLFAPPQIHLITLKSR